MKVLISREGTPGTEIHEVDDDTVLDEVIARFGDGASDADAWIVDDDEPLRRERTLSELEIAEHTEIVIAKRALVMVTVEFNLDERHDSFQPQRKMRRVFEWAVGRDGFGLPRDQRPDHELVPLDSTEAVDPRLPVATYADADGKAFFQLRRKQAFQGCR